ncbi:glycosyltransferase [Pseudoclavibacter helvolus]|uniref:glycosyltransferase n=1 Tax=Pseudoclavibacter helvolus TaxID=255205 RepID=UPI003C738345
MSEIDVIYTHPGGRGWGQIERLAELAATTLGGQLIQVDGSRGYTRMQTPRSLLAAPRRAAEAKACLVIAPHPAHLTSILLGRQWRRRYRKVAGWVIDSFWVDRVPRVARTAGYFDQLYVTGHEDVEEWAAASAAPVSALAWGTDALRMPFTPDDRAIDLQRVGRQPDEWDDDETTRQASEAQGIRYAGRPPFGSDDEQSRRNADESLANAKFTLAFSNIAHTSSYTHPTREYVTGRWLDALSAGAIVAGISPKTASADELFWPGALLELPSSDLLDGLDRIRGAVRAWSPSFARQNRAQALRRLDWRHRLAIVRDELGIQAPHLNEELTKLQDDATRLDAQTEGDLK